MSPSINIEQIIAVAEQLQDLKDEVVFVGGSTTELLVDEGVGSLARQTEDVDFIVDIGLRGEYRQFEETMRSLGFLNDQSEGAPMCRWLIDFKGQALKVDAMPVEHDILGFSNQWYRQSIDTAWEKEIKPGLHIKVIDPVYFLGTKFEAFRSRGNNNIFSHDLEDVIYVLENRSKIELIVFDADTSIKSYLAEAFGALLKHPDLENTLPGMLDSSNAVNVVMSRIQFISQKC